jgi:hypothetical protein
VFEHNLMATEKGYSCYQGVALFSFVSQVMGRVIYDIICNVCLSASSNTL